jgi:hypothetical protein
MEILSSGAVFLGNHPTIAVRRLMQSSQGSVVMRRICVV